MQEDFHYYATCCAALLAGFPYEDSLQIALSANFTDCCSATLLKKLNAPLSAATTQLQLELMDSPTDVVGLQNITRIWASFHFLPRDLTAVPPGICTRRYRNKYRLICGPNGPLVRETVELAKGKGCEAAGLAMHVLADTWAHRNFAGTPSFVINNTDRWFFEILPDGSERPVVFRHNPGAADDPEKGAYTGSIHQSSENSVMNLGHGRAGHLPDYSFMRYRYLPAWGHYGEIRKDNPSDYYHAFCQMVKALQYLRGTIPSFETDAYAFDTVAPYESEIRALLEKRRLSAGEDWKALGERLSGKNIPPFDTAALEKEYASAEKEARDNTFLGRYIMAALAQKSMVTHAIFRSGSLLAGFSVDYESHGFRGIRDFRQLLKAQKEESS